MVGGDLVDGVGQNWTVILGTLGIALVVYLLGSLRVLWQYERGVVFLLGEFEDVREPGLTLNFCARLRCKSVAKTITKDNVSIHIAAVAYYHISAVLPDNMQHAMEQRKPRPTVSPVE